MVICRYFLQGRCKYGTQCINEHPGVSPGTAMNGGPMGPRQGFHRNQSVIFNGPTAMTPPQPSHYAGSRPLSGPERGGRGGSVHPHPPGPSAATLNHQQIRPQQQSNQIRPEDVIYHDLAEVQMQWPLGCYGLNCSWESGDNVIRDDYSPEELRCEAYAQWRSVGNIQQYEQTLKAVLEKRRHLVEDLKSNLARAVAMARTPRTYRLAAEEAQNLTVPATATAHPIAQKVPDVQTQPLPQHHTSTQQHIVGEPALSSVTAAPPLAPTYTSHDFDSFTFGDIPELPP